MDGMDGKRETEGERLDRKKREKRERDERRQECDSHRTEMAPWKRAMLEGVKRASEGLEAITKECLACGDETRRSELMKALNRIRNVIGTERGRAGI